MNPQLSKDFPAVIHCEGSLEGDPRACCDLAAGRDTVTSPQWVTRRFIFAVHHQLLADRCCPVCIAWLRRMLRDMPAAPGDLDDASKRFALIELDL